ncbi:unnamed protein product [Cylicostephanus goldi]|uniref:Uncharacterized protein n=1 Tax=Cylicostephanus goldi TaxID=71465 RepID=A0A3P6STM6_CYLGO|nr:unnamed protein product [Cylicostephanus goldi]
METSWKRPNESKPKEAATPSPLMSTPGTSQAEDSAPSARSKESSISMLEEEDVASEREDQDRTHVDAVVITVGSDFLKFILPGLFMLDFFLCIIFHVLHSKYKNIDENSPRILVGSTKKPSQMMSNPLKFQLFNCFLSLTGFLFDLFCKTAGLLGSNIKVFLHLSRLVIVMWRFFLCDKNTSYNSFRTPKESINKTIKMVSNRQIFNSPCVLYH